MRYVQIDKIKSQIACWNIIYSAKMSEIKAVEHPTLKVSMIQINFNFHVIFKVHNQICTNNEAAFLLRRIVCLF